MLYVLVRWALNALFLMLIPSFIRGVGFENFYAALITAVVLGVLNALIRPVLLLLTLPINFLTLGLFTLVINGLLFWLTSTVVKGFFVEGFWPAFWAALIFSIFSFIVSWIDKKIEAKV